MRDNEINYTKAAFLQPWNLVFLIVGFAAALGIGMLSTNFTVFSLLFIFVCALELLVLGTVPNFKNFRRKVDLKHQKERSKPPTDEELFRQLGRSNQRRYIELQNLGEQIKNNYHKISFASQPLLDSHIEKIKGLRSSFVSLLSEQERQARFRQNMNEQDVVEAITSLRREIEHDSERVRNVKKCRMKILEQRLERFKKSHEQMEMIEVQIETIEDVVKYIHEQSITLRNPEEITYQLDILLDEVANTEASINLMEELFEPSLAGSSIPEEDWLNPAARRARA